MFQQKKRTSFFFLKKTTRFKYQFTKTIWCLNKQRTRRCCQAFSLIIQKISNIPQFKVRPPKEATANQTETDNSAICQSDSCSLLSGEHEAEDSAAAPNPLLLIHSRTCHFLVFGKIHPLKLRFQTPPMLFKSSFRNIV